jgi:branched-chain amino acid transport system substrate-binding protein
MRGKLTRGRRTLIGLTAVVSATALLAGCGGLDDKAANATGGGGAGDADSDYVIGLATALTGDFAEIGKDSQRGAQMAIDEINDAGGFAGHPGKLVVQDSAGKPASGVNAVARLTQDSGIQALLGPDLSTVTLAALDTSKQANVPQLTSSISPAVTSKGSD